MLQLLHAVDQSDKKCEKGLRGPGCSSRPSYFVCKARQEDRQAGRSVSVAVTPARCREFLIVTLMTDDGKTQNWQSDCSSQQGCRPGRNHRNQRVYFVTDQRTMSTCIQSHINMASKSNLRYRDKLLDFL